jgi:arginase
LRELGYKVEDAGNIAVPVRATIKGDNTLPAIRDACEQIYQAARQAVSDGVIPLFLGGDHSIAIGTVGGVTHRAPSAIIWVDAHGDFNTPRTSRSGNIHGMALAVLSGKGRKRLIDIGRPGRKIISNQVVLIGVRDLDPGEREKLRRSNIVVYTMRDIDEQGINRIARAALSAVAHLPRIHVSLDMDCLDPQAAPGVGTPVEGGLTYREAHLLMEIIADSERLASMDIVEINPIIDTGNRTAKMAIELAVSGLGKRIL